MLQPVSNFIKTHWVLLLTIAVFIMLKIPHLSYPYYWDESWPYATAISSMHQHGASLLPSALDPELSRGHPLLFHALAALWMQLFGSSHIAMHSFALTIAVILLVSIYTVGLRLFGRQVAILALLLLASQVAFFVQASGVLLEVLTALLAFASLYYYSRGRYLLASISLAMLFYIKESGLVAGVVIGVHALITAFNNHAPLRIRIYRLLAIVVPTLLFAAFVLAQYHLRGWYFPPYHSELLEHTWQGFWYKLRMAPIKDLFYNCFKLWYFIPLLVLAIAAAGKHRQPRYLAILLPAFCIYYFVDDMRAGRLLPSIPFFIVFVLSVAYFLYSYAKPPFFPRADQRRFIVLSGAFILCYLCFSAANFYTYRYLMAALVPLVLITAVLLHLLTQHTYPRLYAPMAIVLLAVNACWFSSNTGYGDTELGAYTAMTIQQNTVTWLEQHNCFNKQVSCGSYLDRIHLTDASSGFLHTARTFRNARWLIDSSTEYTIFNNLEPDKRYEQIKTDTAYKLIYSTGDSQLWAEIYEHHKPAHHDQ